MISFTESPFRAVVTRRVPPGWVLAALPMMASFCVEKEVEQNLLQLALVAVHGGQIGERGLHFDLRGLELVLEQRERVMDDLVQVDARELRAAGTREVEKAVHDLGGAEGLLRDLFQQRRNGPHCRAPACPASAHSWR